MSATNTVLKAEKPVRQRKEFPLVESRNRIEKKSKKKMRRTAKKPISRKAYKANFLLDHYCSNCQHDLTELLDHYCSCSHGDTWRACRHEFELGDDHWCPSSDVLDQDVLDEFDFRAQNRQAEVLHESALLDGGENATLVPNNDEST
ncbi:hypothetical protein RRF57_010280 [Xylaria bambusicola]|uniref:Uncharacterized protein n=1 Tax=Xylaria bambusicola TaxID=326684 RepID=A0AAN7Z9F7_9PEZI